MKGKVLDFTVQTNSGVISGDDGKRYTFKGNEWKEKEIPKRGMVVDFEVKDGEAVGVYLDLDKNKALSTRGERKDKVAAGLLAIFLGGLGIHKFYLGFTGPGLVYLLVNTIGFAVTWLFLFIPNIVLGIMALIEGIIYLTKTDEEFYQTYVVEKKQWF